MDFLGPVASSQQRPPQSRHTVRWPNGLTGVLMGVAEVSLIHCYNSNEMTFRGLSRASRKTPTGPSDVTRLLADWQGGNKLALDQLMPLVYRELRKVAASYLKDERRNHTLQPTALIHESYLRMVDQDFPQWQN